VTTSIAERALCVIESKLKAIRQEDGYSNSAGLNVFRSRRNLDPDDLPAAVLWDLGEQTTGDAPVGDVEINLSIGVEIHAAMNEDDTGSTIEAIKRDVKRAIYRDNKYGALICEGGRPVAIVGYNGAQLFPRQDGAISESITLKFTIRFKESLDA